jgi:hypothetical protein
MSESTIRPSGFYWIEDADGEPEPARWDAEGEFWVLLGTEEGQADAVVTVLAPLQGPR